MQRRRVSRSRTKRSNKKVSRKNTAPKNTKKRYLTRQTKGGAFERLTCGEVRFASTYRPLSFGEKVKMKFCKDTEPEVEWTSSNNNL